MSAQTRDREYKRLKIAFFLFLGMVLFAWALIGMPEIYKEALPFWVPLFVFAVVVPVTVILTLLIVAPIRDELDELSRWP